MSNVAEAIIRKCGGHHVVADICGVHVTRVYRWTYPREKGGSDGLIPARHHAQLLRGARARSIALVPNDFFTPEQNAVSKVGGARQSRSALSEHQDRADCTEHFRGSAAAAAAVPIESGGDALHDAATVSGSDCADDLSNENGQNACVIAGGKVHRRALHHLKRAKA